MDIDRPDGFDARTWLKGAFLFASGSARLMIPTNRTPNEQTTLAMDSYYVKEILPRLSIQQFNWNTWNWSPVHVFIYSCHASPTTILFSHSPLLPLRTSISQAGSTLLALIDIPTATNCYLSQTVGTVQAWGFRIEGYTISNDFTIITILTGIYLVCMKLYFYRQYVTFAFTSTLF